MNIVVKCFSQVRYALGTSELILDLPEGSTTADLEQKIRQRGGEALARITLRTAVNRQYCQGPIELTQGDEVAFIPPVQGG
ncbi:MAG: MoaD/ThiS family protein [Fidelibacterota bacterium]